MTQVAARQFVAGSFAAGIGIGGFMSAEDAGSSVSGLAVAGLGLTLGTAQIHRVGPVGLMMGGLSAIAGGALMGLLGTARDAERGAENLARR